MRYPFTYEHTISGRCVAEIDMRAEIEGDVTDWIVSSIEVYEIGSKLPESRRWFELPKEHLMRPEIIRHLTSPDVAARIDDAYAEHVAETEDRVIPSFADEHRHSVREMV